MKLWKNLEKTTQRLLKPLTDGGDLGGGQASQAVPGAEGNPGAESNGGFDAYGYAIAKPVAGVTPPPPPPAPAAQGEGTNQPQQTPAAEPKAERFSGYGAEPVAPGDDGHEPAAPAVPESKEDIGLPYDLKIEGVERGHVDQIKAFAKQHNLTQEQAQAIVDTRRDETKAFQTAQQQAIEDRKNAQIAQRKEWYQSLKSDPSFGGDQFDNNVLVAERTFDEYFPETKKELTARKAMMPPWLMRDMAALAKKLSATPQFTKGDARPPVATTSDDPLDFYNKK